MTPTTNNSSKSRHLEYGIRQIIDLDIHADWEWYQNAICDLVDKLGIQLVDDADFEALNAGKVTDGQIMNWVCDNTELQTVEH